MRPWSTGGKPKIGTPSYAVGGDHAAPGSASGAVWVQTGPNGEYVRQTTTDGQGKPPRRSRRPKIGYGGSR
jgi:hypothetical protein